MPQYQSHPKQGPWSEHFHNREENNNRGNSRGECKSENRNGNSPASKKDPYEVLGITKDATQAQIKAAYRRLALKHHPDRVPSDGPDGGQDAKKKATALFSEISAAYELLTSENNESASHPSFADSGNISPNNSYESYYTPGFEKFPASSRTGHQRFMDPFFADEFTDPFGFGTFGHFSFSDPFELFRKNFGNSVNGTSSKKSKNGNMGIPSPWMNSSTSFGRFPPTLFDDAMGKGFEDNFTSSMLKAGNGANTIQYSTSYQRIGNGGINRSSSRMVSATTRIMNGKAVTRREETIIGPDGKKTTTIDLTEDTDREGIKPWEKYPNTQNGISFGQDQKNSRSSSAALTDSSAEIKTKRNDKMHNLSPKRLNFDSNSSTDAKKRSKISGTGILSRSFKDKQRDEELPENITIEGKDDCESVTSATIMMSQADNSGANTKNNYIEEKNVRIIM